MYVSTIRPELWCGGGAIRFNSRNNSRNMEPDGEERNRSNPTLKGEIRCFSALSGCSIGLLF